MSLVIKFNEAEQGPETLTFEQIKRQDGLYELTDDPSSNWAILISSGGQVYVTAKDGYCVLATASDNWTNRKYIKSAGKLVFSN